MMPRFPKLYRRLLDQEYAWLRILLFALVLRLGLLIVVGDDPLVSDSRYYHQAAIAWVDHGQLDTYWPPGLPAYEAAWIWIFGNGEIWVRLAMLPWFLWLCRSFYHITYRLHSRVAANLGLLLLALYPALIHQSVEPLSYLPAAAILMALFGHVQAYIDDRRRGQLWRAGLLIGLLILFRPAAAIFLIALPPLILVRRRKFVPGFVLLIFAALVVGPWIWLASSQSGRFIPVNDANSRNFYLGNNAWTPAYKTWYYGSHWTADPKLPAGFRAEIQGIEALPTGEQGRAYTRAAWADIGARPGAFVVRTASRMRTLIAFDAFAGARLRWSGHALANLGYALLGLEASFFVLLGIAFMAFWFSDARRELSGSVVAMVSGFLLLYALPYWFSFSHPTYHLPMVPLMLLPAAVWLRRVFELAAFPRWRGGMKVLPWLAILAFLAIQVEWIIQMLFIPPQQ